MVQVLCVCLSKYEIDTLRQVMQQVDPDAFYIVQEGVHASAATSSAIWGKDPSKCRSTTRQSGAFAVFIGNRTRQTGTFCALFTSHERQPGAASACAAQMRSKRNPVQSGNVIIVSYSFTQIN